tara:strand:+ start:14215 stop:15201 length:987 start_codon:yes stop_codon:yes gene_type:complete
LIKSKILEELTLTFQNKISNYKNIVDKELKSIYNKGPLNLTEPINHILSGGKRLRPLLCLLTASAFKGSKKDALIASVAIELLHNFTLIHDDIMDNDDIRHGLSTIHNKWNNSIAILAGDATLAIALIHLNRLTENKNLIIEHFNYALIQVCEGQALDLAFQYNMDISEEDYISMIDKKTGYIIGLCSMLGSIISKNDNSINIKLKKYGILIGRAFQIQDDLLEITSNQNKMGKSLKSDFLLNKKTYLTIKANSINSNIVNKCIKTAKNDFNLGFSKYKNFLVENGIVDESIQKINGILASARSILDGLDMNNKYLYEYIKLILNRDA